MADKAKNSISRVSFTLPISCQICLGKVKDPVLCPNHHVFCSPCMDVWLERNQQCPSCRVSINEDNPCKQILGGRTPNDEEDYSFAKSKELRRSRLELLCKGYEDEVDRLQAENESLQHAKSILEEQLKAHAAEQLAEAEQGNLKAGGTASKGSAPDVNMLLMLTQKLQDATGLYERVKRDMDKLKKENTDLKDENAAMSRENQRLRMEVFSRSPRKYSRITVATLETKLEKYEKEMQQLQKALERSDAYIEQVEQELSSHRQQTQQQSICFRCKTTTDIEKPSWTKMADSGEHLGERVVLGGHDDTDKSEQVRDRLGLSKGSRQEKGVPSQSSTNSADNDYLNSKDKITGSNSDNNGDGDSKKPLSTISFYGKRPLVQDKGKRNSLKDKGSKDTSSTTQQDDSFSMPSTSRSTAKPLLNEMSFDLELPSPVKSPRGPGAPGSRRGSQDNGPMTHSYKVTISDEESTINDTGTVDDTLASTSSAGSCKKKLRFDQNSIDLSLLTVHSPTKNSKGKGKCSGAAIGGDTTKQVTFNKNVAVKNVSRTANALTDSLLDVTLPSDTSEVDVLNDIKTRRTNEQDMVAFDDTLDTSMSVDTTDIIDCMELFSGAERRLGERKQQQQGKQKDADFKQNKTDGSAEHDKAAWQKNPESNLSLGLLGSQPSRLTNSMVFNAQSSSLDPNIGNNTYSTSTQANLGELGHSGRHAGFSEASVPRPFLSSIGTNHDQRPDATQMLQGMLQRASNLGEEAARPLSAPGSLALDRQYFSSHGPKSFGTNFDLGSVSSASCAPNSLGPSSHGLGAFATSTTSHGSSTFTSTAGVSSSVAPCSQGLRFHESSQPIAIKSGSQAQVSHALPAHSSTMNMNANPCASSSFPALSSMPSSIPAASAGTTGVLTLPLSRTAPPGLLGGGLSSNLAGPQGHLAGIDTGTLGAGLSLSQGDSRSGLGPRLSGSQGNLAGPGGSTTGFSLSQSAIPGRSGLPDAFSSSSRIMPEGRSLSQPSLRNGVDMGPTGLFSLPGTSSERLDFAPF